MVKDIFLSLYLDFGHKCLRIKHLMGKVVGVRYVYVVSSPILGQLRSTPHVHKEYAPVLIESTWLTQLTLTWIFTKV